jgi:hypothetical protein
MDIRIQETREAIAKGRAKLAATKREQHPKNPPLTHATSTAPGLRNDWPAERGPPRRLRGPWYAE